MHVNAVFVTISFTAKMQFRTRTYHHNLHQVAYCQIQFYANRIQEFGSQCRLSNVSLSAVAGRPESDLKSQWGSPSVCCVTEADAWPSERAGLLLCVHWCPNAPSQGPTRPSLVLHKRRKQKYHVNQRTRCSFNYLPWSLELMMVVNVLQIKQWKYYMGTSVLNSIKFP